MSALAAIPRAPSLGAQVYSRLRDELRRGRYRPAERLTELGLAAALGVSRTPVREALGQLAREGLIAPLPGGGYGVPILAPADLDDVFEIRALLEPHAAARSAARATEAGVSAMRHALKRERAERANPDPAPFAEANRAFRTALFAMAGNARLAQAIAQFEDHAQFVRAATLAERRARDSVVAGHARILAAVERRDQTAAREAMIAHLAAARRMLDAALAARPS
jgi:DNA-binding GntR family transcriptional regulator